MATDTRKNTPLEIQSLTDIVIIHHRHYVVGTVSKAFVSCFATIQLMLVANGVAE